MPLTLLFDLDDTLLDTHLEAFVPAYFQAITQYFERQITPTVMLRALIQGTHQMSESADPAHTLMQVFDEVFYPALGIPKADLIQQFETFYDEEFPGLSVHTQARPDAVPSAEDIFQRESARKSLVEAVFALEDPYRSALILRYFEDLPPREVARRLGVPVETARTRIKRGLEMLRVRLDREHGSDRSAWCIA